MANIVKQAWNYLTGANSYVRPTDSSVINKNLTRYISPVQLERIRQDVQSWRDAIREAELAWYPFRVKMQRMYQDTVLNGQVKSCVAKRNGLTLLRDYCIVNEDDTENEDATKIFNAAWFKLWMEYGLWALGYGYQLVSLGDMINNGFPHLTIIKRQNISPDRLNVATLVYGIDGVSIDAEQNPEVMQWHSYFTTPTENGASRCGYGYLYPVALYEIYLRNLTGANADYVQVFGQPYRVGKTSKTEEAERALMLQSLLEMGTSNAAVIDPDESIEFIESGGSGSSGHNVYDNFETRLEKKISKLILGHADAIDSTSGKLGAEQGEDSPVAKALKEKKTEDGAYIENMVNDVLIPQLIEIGFNIPVGVKFKFKNDEEEKEEEERENKFNQDAATIMKTISDAGGEPDWKWFEDRTGIKVEKKEVEMPATEPPTEESIDQSQRIKNKLENLYGPR